MFSRGFFRKKTYGYLTVLRYIFSWWDYYQLYYGRIVMLVAILALCAVSGFLIAIPVINLIRGF